MSSGDLVPTQRIRGVSTLWKILYKMGNLKCEIKEEEFKGGGVTIQETTKKEEEKIKPVFFVIYKEITDFL